MKRSNPWTESRLPITFDILSIIVPKLQIIYSSIYEAVLFKAAFTLAFHALLRVGEFALSESNTSDRILLYISGTSRPVMKKLYYASDILKIGVWDFCGC